jgi:hypothetical protein
VELGKPKQHAVTRTGKTEIENSLPSTAMQAVLYHFCRLQLPHLVVNRESFTSHLQRSYALFQSKTEDGVSWDSFLANLCPLDWFVACGCLDGLCEAWEHLFASRSGRTDCLLVDALRARAIRLYPYNEERQENAVNEFWSHLLIPESPGSVPILARYDGQRPLVPWLIRVFQNWHISLLRQGGGMRPLPEEDVAYALPATAESRWHEAFCLAARAHLGELSDKEILILGLRLRYRLSQREVATLLGVHEGTISRQTSGLRERFLDALGRRLKAEGWPGDDLEAFILNEMAALLLDEPRLSADNLSRLLSARGKSLPVQGQDDSS